MWCQSRIPRLPNLVHESFAYVDISIHFSKGTVFAHAKEGLLTLSSCFCGNLRNVQLNLLVRGELSVTQEFPGGEGLPGWYMFRGLWCGIIESDSWGLYDISAQSRSICNWVWSPHFTYTGYTCMDCAENRRSRRMRNISTLPFTSVKRTFKAAYMQKADMQRFGLNFIGLYAFYSLYSQSFLGSSHNKA